MASVEQHSEPDLGTREYWKQREMEFRARVKERIVNEDTETGRAHEAGKSEALKRLGKVMVLAERRRDAALRLEQNLGCELPVCVANRRDVNDVSIRFKTDEGLEWQLMRGAATKLPSPEHYKYWLWFLDRCNQAAEQGMTLAPRIALIPTELSRAFNLAPSGQWYRDVDEAFKCFSHLIVSAHSVFHAGGKQMTTDTTLGTLCYYSSWRDNKGFEGLESRGWIAPGPLLWSSIQNGYLLSVPMDKLVQLNSYIAQRLYTYLSKHCRPGKEYTVSLRKLLPKLPMKTPLEKASSALRRHHADLVKVGFLARAPKFVGRGVNRMVVYQRV